jgi:hypothetical protein
MTEARDGDLAEYRECFDPDCPVIRGGTSHAHLVSVTRAEDEAGR